jgi:hypothetical protein
MLFGFSSDIRMIDKYQSTSDTNVLLPPYLHKSSIALIPGIGIYRSYRKLTSSVYEELRI